MSKIIFIGPKSAHCLVMSVTQLLTSSMLVARLDWCDPEVSCNFSLPYQRSDMRFVQNFTLLDFQANFFTLSISPNFNRFDLLLLKIRPGFCQKPLLLANSVHTVLFGKQRGSLCQDPWCSCSFFLSSSLSIQWKRYFSLMFSNTYNQYKYAHRYIVSPVCPPFGKEN